MDDAPAGRQPERADVSAWLAVAAGTIGAFMATLDISIVNASLAVIQGEIGASGNEGTWISTAFLVAEIIVIIMSGWLERLLGLRRLLLTMASMFILFSMLCGMADDLTTMIIGRIGQGFSGGALIPTAVTIISKRLSGTQQSIGFALFGFTVLQGPIMGPLVGGWLTENLSWRYSFFINLPIGLLLLLLILVGLPPVRSRLELLRTADWPGIAGLILGLGGLTVVLEDGQREQWFESGLIRGLLLMSLFGFAMVAYGQYRSRNPALALYLLRQRTFAVPVMLNLVVGMLFFSTLYLVPQFLASIAGYNSEQVGYVMLVSGIPFLMLAVTFPKLIRILDIRLALAIGLLCLAFSCLVEASLTPDAAGPQFLMSQILRGTGLFFCISFLNQAAVLSVDNSIVEDASAIFNCARNLGGSIGLALVSTMMARRLTLHGDRISESLTANGMRAPDLAGAEGGGHDMTAALLREINRQAAVMAYSDLFLIIGVLILLALPLCLFLVPFRFSQGQPIP